MNKEREAEIVRFWKEKDIYHMAGFDVWDQPCYDTHGLPIENKVQEDEIMASGKANLVC